MTRTCSFWTVSPRLPDDLRRRSSARDHAGPVSHNHKKRTRGALTASLFVVPAPGPSVPGFLFYLPHLLTLLGVVPGYIRRKQHPIRQHHPMRARTPSRHLIAAFACSGPPARPVAYAIDRLRGLSPTPSTGSPACRLRHRQVLRPVAYAIDIAYQVQRRSRQVPFAVVGVADSLRSSRDPRSGRQASTHPPHRHHAKHAGRTSGSSWILQVAERPQRHTLTPSTGKRSPQRNTIMAPA